MAVINEIALQVKATEQQPNDLGTSSLVHRFNLLGAEGLDRITVPNGTGAGEQNRVWSATLALAAAPADLDLAGGLTSKLDGSAVTFGTVLGFALVNKSTTAAEVVTVGGNANAFVNWVGAQAHTVKVGPGGVLFVWDPTDGYAVTAGTGDVLTLDPGAATFDVDLIIWGTP